MAKSTESQPNSAREIPSIADAWLSGFRVNPFVAAGETCSKACSRWLQEYVRFAGERLQKAHEAGSRLASCENPLDLSQLQQECLQEAFAAYIAESNRIVELALAIGNDVFRPNLVNGRESAD